MVEEKERKEIKKQEKKSLFSKIKKPLATGILAAGLLMTPAKKAESVGFSFARDPPTYAADLIKKDYREGWEYILKAKKEWKKDTGGKPWMYNEPAVQYFKKQYEKDKRPESLYLWAYAVYDRAQCERGFEATEKMEMEALELIEKRLKEAPNDFDFIDLKQIIYYNLAVMYRDAYSNDPSPFSHYRDPSKIDFYRQKSTEYSKKWLEYYEDIKGRWDEFQLYMWTKNASKEEIKNTINTGYQEGYKDIETEITEMLKKLNSR